MRIDPYRSVLAELADCLVGRDEAKAQLEAVTRERDAALAKLKTTRSSLASAAGKLSEQNKRLNAPC